tara:strand:+ start:105 stop:602 length:498 start_codon:yes stop_codon:yes gene_type:complete
VKKLLSLSVLILFSCSKDIIVPADSGNKIIGNYQLIQKTSNEQGEYSFWDIREEPPNSLFSVKNYSEFTTTNITGRLSFTSDFKGYYEIIVDGTKNIKVNFDWSFEGGKWYVIDENSETWTIINTDRCVSDKINCDGQENTSALYLMEKEAGYTARDWRFYKLVF